jgi:hypothetical protein
MHSNKAKSKVKPKVDEISQAGKVANKKGVKIAAKAGMEKMLQNADMNSVDLAEEPSSKQDNKELGELSKIDQLQDGNTSGTLEKFKVVQQPLPKL